MSKLPTQFFATLVSNVNRQVALGHDVINLGQGNPDLPTPSHIVNKLKESAENPLYHKYSPFTGYSFLKEAIAKRYKEEYNVDLDPESEVAILFGGKTGLVQLPQILLNPDDLCLVPDPGYPDYWSGVALAQAKMSFMLIPHINNATSMPRINGLSLPVPTARINPPIRIPKNISGYKSARPLLPQ